MTIYQAIMNHSLTSSFSTRWLSWRSVISCYVNTQRLQKTSRTSTSSCWRTSTRKSI